MSIVSKIKQPFKNLRWRARRAATLRRWGTAELARMPIVIGNAMPKSGSHLLFQVLQGLTRIGPFVDPGMPPINRSTENRNLSDDEILANLQSLNPGDITYSYLHARKPFIEQLTLAGVAPFFIYRDPRDVIVSHVFYATEIYSGHGMHRYYTETLSNMEQRINAAIKGVPEPGAKLSAIMTKYEHYIGWLKQPGVLALRFEDLIIDRRAALGRVLDHLSAHDFDPQPRQQAIDALEAGLQPRASGTFRRGQTGDWRQHFTEANKQTFKSETGDLLQKLGYEKDTEW
jgi:hypothetical protein